MRGLGKFKVLIIIKKISLCFKLVTINEFTAHCLLSTTYLILKKSIRLSIVFFLFIRIILCMRRTSLLIFWVSLELNIITFLTLLFFSKTNRDCLLYYFLVQRIASRIFLGTIFLIHYINNRAYLALITLRIIIKLGAAPLHTWFIYLINNLNWNNLFLLAIVQKIIPFYILAQNQFWIKGIVWWSILIGIGGAYFQEIFKTLLAYSSVFNTGWILIALPDMFLVLFYIIIYGLGLLIITISLNKSISNRITYVKTSHFNHFNINQKIILTFGLLNIGGFPPFIGFLRKIILLINSIISYREIFLLTFSSILLIYFYAKLFYNSFFINYNTTHLVRNRWSLNSFINPIIIILLIRGPIILFFFLCIGVRHKRIWLFRIF